MKLFFGVDKMLRPFCWKCASKITESNGGNSSSLIGCKEEDKIHNYSDAEKLCPLMEKNMSKKVVIVLSGGTVYLSEKPNDIEIEIRDHDIEGDWDPDNKQCKTDNDGDRYQEIIFPAKDKKTTVEFLPMTEDEPITMTNYYQCENCHTKWQDEWSCACDDECPKCGVIHSPYKSEDI